MPPAHPSRLRTAVFAGIRSPLRWTVLLLAVYVAANAHAQGTLPLTAVVTDQTPLDLSDRFGIPAASGVDQLGNFAFIGRGNSALFLRRTGSATIERLLQAGDEVPGFPGSSVLDFSLPVQELAVPGAAPMMAAGRMAFIVEFSTGDGFTHQAVCSKTAATARWPIPTASPRAVEAIHMVGLRCRGSMRGVMWPSPPRSVQPIPPPLRPCTLFRSERPRRGS